MKGPLLCVGGPLDKQYREVPPYARSLIVHAAPEFWLRDAGLDSAKAAEIPNSISCEQMVYKVVPLGYAFPGGDLRINVLAYFGSSRKDRPEGFYL